MPQDNPSSEPHRWGSFKDSLFHRLVVDVFSGLGMPSLELGKYERRLVDIMILESWTRAFLQTQKGEEPEAVPVDLRTSEIADRHGYKRTRISEAKASLIERGILVEVEEGCLFNKDVPAWKGPCGKRGLTTRELAICIEDASKNPRRQTRKDGARSYGAAELAVTVQRNCEETAVTVQRNSNYGAAYLELRPTVTESEPPQTPIEERAREEEKREEDKDNTTQSVVVVSDGEEEQRRQSLLQFQSKLWNRGQHDLEQPGPHDPDPARWDAWLAIADRLDFNPEVRAGFLSKRRQWPTEWLVLVVKLVHHKHLHNRGPRPKRFQYYQTILESWADDGHTEAGEWDFLDDGLQPIPPSQRRPKVYSPAGAAPREVPRQPSAKPDIASFYNPNRPRPVPYGSARPIREASE